MNYSCPNYLCKSDLETKKVIKDGSFFRSSDSRKIQRYRCKVCGRRFSRATFSLAINQKKRRVNHQIFKLLASGVSMRRCAKILSIHQITVARKVEYLAKKAKQKQERLLLELRDNQVEHLQIDDLITIEHTKLKPVSVSIAVDAKRRIILGAEVSKIPAFGHLAIMSRNKYGYRKSEHKEGLERLFKSIYPVISKDTLVESDEHKLYPECVKRYFSSAQYKRYKGGRGCVAGQGELKKLKKDPLFILNHTCAMFRANVNRLIRKTWCTTKRIDRLKMHLDIYVWYHNYEILSG